MNEDRYTVRLTAAQHRLLRDLVHWAWADSHEDQAPRYDFWEDIVAEWARDESAATMRQLEDILNPRESSAGGTGAPTE